MDKLGLCMALLILETIGSVSGAKIILAASQLGSHILEHAVLGEELASRGHQVYMAIGSRYPKRESIEKRGIKTLQYRIPQDVLFGVSEDFERAIADIVFQPSENKMAASGSLASELCNRDCSYMMSDDNFMETVRKINFDLAIVDDFIWGPCIFLLPHSLGIPYASTTGFFVPWKIRVPAFPSISPIMSTWVSLSDATFLPRLGNFLIYLCSDIYLSLLIPPNTTLLERYAPDLTSWNDLERKSVLFLVGSDHHFGNTIPHTQNYISMAGLTTSKAKNLPEDLERILAESEDGVILLSFGGSAYYFPESVIVKFLSAFANLKQTVLVKFYIPDGVTLPKNVKALSWLPQNDILGHPKTLLFITHCGNSGQHEALYHGVPMIGFPLFAEQHRNCHQIYQKGFGLQMTVQSFTSDELFKNIQEVLNNPKYRSTIKKASEAFRDQPMHPRERAAFWVEHVIKHGGEHLRSIAMDMPLYQFLMLDVIGLIVFCVFVIAYFIRYMGRYIYKKCVAWSKSPNQTKLKSN